MWCHLWMAPFLLLKRLNTQQKTEATNGKARFLKYALAKYKKVREHIKWWLGFTEKWLWQIMVCLELKALIHYLQQNIVGSDKELTVMAEISFLLSIISSMILLWLRSTSSKNECTWAIKTIEISNFIPINICTSIKWKLQGHTEYNKIFIYNNFIIIKIYNKMKAPIHNKVVSL